MGKDIDFGISVLTDENTLKKYSHDWHRLSEQRPFGVVRATFEDDVVGAIRFAEQEKLKAVVRASGHGSGSVLGKSCLVIDIAGLRQVHEVTSTSITIGAGASWHDAIDALKAVDCTTLAQTDWQGLSIGGILSVGGLGPALFRSGPLLEQVTSLILVTGRGEKLHLDRGHPLFRAALRGRGQFGVIVRVQIGRLQCPRMLRARVYRAVTTLESMRAGYKTAVSTTKIANLQSFPRHNTKGAFGHFDKNFAELEAEVNGEWVALNEFVVFFNGKYDKSNDGELLSIFRPISEDAVSVTEMSYEEWIFRLDKVFGPRAGVNEHDDFVQRPWFEVFIGGTDVDDAIAFVSEKMLQKTTVDQMPRGSLAVIYPMPSLRVENSISMAMPSYQSGAYFGLLRVAEDEVTAASFHARDCKWHSDLLRSGRGRGYLSSTAPTTDEEWSMFYGEECYRELQLLCKVHDPHSLLSWRLA